MSWFPSAYKTYVYTIQFSSVTQPCLTFCDPMDCSSQDSPSITNSQGLLKLMSTESVMSYNHLILCCPLLLPPSIFPSIRVFSNESLLLIRWPKYGSFSFSISPSSEYSFRMDWLDLMQSKGLSSLLQQHSSKASILQCSVFFTIQLTSIHDYCKNHSFDYGAMLSKSLIQFSVEGWGCVPSLLFDLRPNYGGGNEDSDDLLQKFPCMHCYIQCPQPCSRPPPTHASARDSWTLTGKSRSVSCGVTAPFFWVLVGTWSCLHPPRVCFSSPV